MLSRRLRDDHSWAGRRRCRRHGDNGPEGVVCVLPRHDGEDLVRGALRAVQVPRVVAGPVVVHAPHLAERRVRRAVCEHRVAAGDGGVEDADHRFFVVLDGVCHPVHLLLEPWPRAGVVLELGRLVRRALEGSPLPRHLALLQDEVALREGRLRRKLLCQLCAEGGSDVVQLVLCEAQRAHVGDARLVRVGAVVRVRTRLLQLKEQPDELAPRGQKLRHRVRPDVPELRRGTAGFLPLLLVSQVVRQHRRLCNQLAAPARPRRRPHQLRRRRVSAAGAAVRAAVAAGPTRRTVERRLLRRRPASAAAAAARGAGSRRAVDGAQHLLCVGDALAADPHVRQRAAGRAVPVLLVAHDGAPVLLVQPHLVYLRPRVAHALAAPPDVLAPVPHRAEQVDPGGYAALERVQKLLQEAASLCDFAALHGLELQHEHAHAQLRAVHRRQLHEAQLVVEGGDQRHPLRVPRQRRPRPPLLLVRLQRHQEQPRQLLPPRRVRGQRSLEEVRLVVARLGQQVLQRQRVRLRLRRQRPRVVEERRRQRAHGCILLRLRLRPQLLLLRVQLARRLREHARALLPHAARLRARLGGACDPVAQLRLHRARRRRQRTPPPLALRRLRARRALQRRGALAEGTLAGELEVLVGVVLQEHARLAHLRPLLAQVRRRQHLCAELRQGSRRRVHGGVRTLRDDLEACGELRKGRADGEAGLADLHSAEDTAGLQLRHHRAAVDKQRLLRRVRLHAADPVRGGAVDQVHELHQLAAEEATQRHGARVLLGLREDGRDQRVCGRAHQQLHRRLQRVPVLLQPALDGVVDARGVVVHDEGVLRHLLLCKERVARAVLDHLRQETFVGARPHGALVVEQGEHPDAVHHQPQARAVVRALHLCYVNALRPALVHVLREDVVVVVVLQRLVRKVDAQLLERVVLEVLEPEDVEQPDPVLPSPRVRVLVDLLHLPPEHRVVQPLADRVTAVDGLCDGERLRHVAVAGLQGGGGQLGCEHALVHLPLLRAEVDERGTLGVGLGAVVVDGLEAAAEQVEDAGDGAPDAVDVAAGEAAVGHRSYTEVVVLCVVDACDVDARAGIHVAHGDVRRRDAVPSRVLPLRAQVEGVVAPLVRVRRDDPALLQKVLDGVRPHKVAGFVELHLHELPESRRVVVPHSLRVAEALEHGRRLVDVEGDLLRVLPVRLHAVHAREGAQVLHHNLRRLRLARPRLARDEDGLVLRVAAKVVVRVVRLRPRVRRAVLHDL
eukprot:Rhum_TRINITY_DN14191_c0_g1::Rhum_TRINITY_DN14191_c0_g1_i1::g.71560::m.71560